MQIVAQTHLLREGQTVTIKQGNKDLGFCKHWKDKRSNISGFNAYAYKLPVNGAGTASLADFKKLRDALNFVERNGVAL